MLSFQVPQVCPRFSSYHPYTIWKGFGEGQGCGQLPIYDPIVKYDRFADRWVISHGSSGVSLPPNFEVTDARCIAVSRTGDPSGAYARYEFDYHGFPDSNVLAVWPGIYFATMRMFESGIGATFLGTQVCAYNRGAMLMGLPATQQCVALGPDYASMILPSDLEGNIPPPAGSPNYLLSLASNNSSLNLLKFHVDFDVPAKSKLSGPINISVSAFTRACGDGACIPQLNATQQLGSLSDRLMYRLAYRNFGDHESMVVNHSVAVGTSVGIRWYELRRPGTTPIVFQQGTFAPNSSYRWLGSMAMDRKGDIALGYSISSSTLNPGIRFTGRLSSDPLGVLRRRERIIINGTGSQTFDIWGRLSSMVVDPRDDCTFWYTNQYLKNTGIFNWHTRIASFKLPGC